MAADEQLRRKLLPEDWKWCLVRGKDAFGQGTSTDPLSTENTLKKVNSKRHRQTGLGVVTGDASNGLVAVDIDGPLAEEAFKKILGESWPATLTPGTMSWRGRPGRRQLLYQIPPGIRPLLGKFTKEQMVPELKGTDDEVCIRYNGCYSVIPGSMHPDTGKPYEWIDRHNGEPALAPGWLVNFMMESGKAQEVHSFLPASYLERQDASTDYTYRQMRRHFFMRGGLLEQLLAKEDGFSSIYVSEVWDNQPLSVENEEKGTLVGGCPFHDSNSGKSFTLWPNLNWYCHKEETGGDALKLLHALKERDIDAGEPTPIQLQGYLTEIAEVVGSHYPEDFRDTLTVKKETKYDTTRALLDHIREIGERFENPAEEEIELMILADEYGVRRSPADLRFLLAKDEAYRVSGRALTARELCLKTADPEFIIPEIVQKPQTAIIHGDANAGKTALCAALATVVVRGLPFKVRDEMMPVLAGKVLWFTGDCNDTEMKMVLLDADLEDNNDFIVVPDFKLSHKARFQREVSRHQPSLVVIDSLSSASDAGVDENKKEAAEPLYWLNSKNGTLWPACAILIIHHDNKDGQYRGSSAIRAAVSEMWHVAEVPEDKREHLPNYLNQRLVTNGKSRNGMKGRKLLSTLNDDYTVQLEDWRPEGFINADGQLSIRDRVLKAVRDSDSPLTRQQIEIMAERPLGDAAVRKALQRLVMKKLINQREAGGSTTRGGKITHEYFALKASRGESDNNLSHWERSTGMTEETPMGHNGTPMGQLADLEPKEAERPPNPTVDSAPPIPDQLEMNKVHLSRMGQPMPKKANVPLGNEAITGISANGTAEENYRDQIVAEMEVGEPPSWDELL